MSTIRFTVQGMKCGGCESGVKQAVGACPGVISVAASHKEQSVDVEYDASVADLSGIKKAITDRGFTVAS
jgi:copper chaperone